MWLQMAEDESICVLCTTSLWHSFGLALAGSQALAQRLSYTLQEEHKNKSGTMYQLQPWAKQLLIHGSSIGCSFSGNICSSMGVLHELQSLPAWVLKGIAVKEDGIWK